MRLFTGIDIPDSVKLPLGALLDRLRPLAKLAWSPVENLHITTKFIGEWPENRVGEIRTALAVLPAVGPIEVAVRGLGWFPNARNPRVLWAGVEAGPELAALALATEQRLATLGVPCEDRDFSPHLTLARRRDPVPVERLEKELAALASSERAAPDFGAFRAESFFLFQSKAGRYVKLEEFPLT